MKTFLYRLLLLQLLALAIILFILCFAETWWLADILTHFALPNTLLAAITFTALLATRTKRYVRFLAGFVLMIFAVQVVSLLMPRHLTQAVAYDNVTILQFNMNLTNSKVDIEMLVSQTLPDVIILQEATPAVTNRLNKLIDSYPYQLISPRDDGFGSAIYSKIPMTSKERHSFECSGNDYSDIHLRTLHGVNLGLIELHTMAPMNAKMSAQRNAELREITVRVNQQEAQAKILVGDMNITAYSPFFWQLTRNTRLYSAMQGRGMTGTWPSVMPAFLRIPIDNLLVSDNIEVLEQYTETAFGSDHVPLVTKLRVYATE